MFINRQHELSYLNSLLASTQAGNTQLAIITGRRRVGKTELLLHWVQQSGVPYLYWQAVKETPHRQRTRFIEKIFEPALSSAPAVNSWRAFWDSTARLITKNFQVLILDNLPYAIEADEEFLPALRSAWENYFRGNRFVLILCGSHGRVMNQLLSEKSQLGKLVTSHLQLEPLPYSSTQKLFPAWDIETRMTAYAISGGVPAYLAWLDPTQDLLANIEQTFFLPGGLFQAEPDILLFDDLRETTNYFGIMKAISDKAHTLTEISEWTGIPVTSVTFYLGVLQDLHLVKRQIPITTDPSLHGRSRNGRYSISDAFFRFFLRFIDPFLADYPYKPGQVMDFFSNNLPNFVGETAFPELARRWILSQTNADRLPFIPETVGSFWNNRIQFDVVGINRKSRDILLGECKWGADPVDLLEVRALIEKKARWVLQDLPSEGDGWQVHYAFFARRGFLPPAYHQLQKFNGLAVNINNLDAVLGQE